MQRAHVACWWIACISLGCVGGREGKPFDVQSESATDAEADAAATAERSDVERSDAEPRGTEVRDSEPGDASWDAHVEAGADPNGTKPADAGIRLDADADASAADSGAALAPPRTLRGDPAASFWDLSVRGAGLARHEGKLVTIRVGVPERPPERLGFAQARIEGGAFELFFAQVWEAGLYKVKRAFVDVDQNGRCDPASDAVFFDGRGAQVAALVIRDVFSEASQTDFSKSLDPQEDCAALNASWPEK